MDVPKELQEGLAPLEQPTSGRMQEQQPPEAHHSQPEIQEGLQVGTLPKVLDVCMCQHRWLAPAVHMCSSWAACTLVLLHTAELSWRMSCLPCYASGVTAVCCAMAVLCCAVLCGATQRQYRTVCCVVCSCAAAMAEQWSMHALRKNLFSAGSGRHCERWAGARLAASSDHSCCASA